MKKKHNATEAGFVVNMLKHYPRLTKAWFYDRVMKLTSNQTNCIGVHRIDNKKDHVPGNCFFEVQELNIQQHDAIPNLTEPWMCVFKHFVNVFEGREDTCDHMQLFRNQFALTPKDLGITNSSSKKEYYIQCYEMHFLTNLMQRIRNYIRQDIKAKRFQLSDGMSVGQLAKKVYPNAILQLEAQHGCCFYTKIGLTHTKSCRQLSLERHNNALPHFTHDGQLPNCAFICRLFNVPRKLSRTMMLEYFLQQKLVPISDDVRKHVQNILYPPTAINPN